MNATQLVNVLLEAEEKIDWSPDPNEPDALSGISQGMREREASGVVDKYTCEMARVGQWLYHRPTGKRAKVNGRCRTWKREPEKFALPMKHGLYVYFYITPENANDWSTIPVKGGAS